MFDSKKFNHSKLIHREEIVKVPDLKQWFSDKAEWTVRGLSHKELAIADAKASDNGEELLLQALSQNDNDKVKAIRQVAGIVSDSPKETKKRIEHLIMGSVDPKIDNQTAVKLSIHYPIVFGMLTNTIIKLTGLGSEAKVKPQPSGKEMTSD